MDRIRKIYRTFIPFLVIFIGFLLLILIFDTYAERLTRKPEIIEINVQSESYNTDAVSWRISESGNSIQESIISKDSIYILARKAYRNKDYTTASEQFTVLKNSHPFSPIPWNYLGMISVREGAYPEATKQFEQALEVDSTCNDAIINLASAYSKMKRHAEAQKLYLKALQVKPNDPEIHYNIGILYRQEKDQQNAIEAFTRSIDLSSGEKRANSLVQRGIIKLSLLDTIEAREDFKEAILLVPDSEIARINYSHTLRDREMQLSEIRKIYNLNNRSFYANLSLGRFYEEHGDIRMAEYHYIKALEQDPSHAELIENLANILIDQERMEEADLIIDGFIAGDTLPQAYFLKAKMVANRGEPDAAKRLYRLAISRAQNNYPEAAVNLAILMKEQQNYKEAVQMYKSALQSRPRYSLAWYNLALIYVETDSIPQAITSYQNSIKYDSSSYKSWYNLGQLFEQEGDYDAEISAYRKAISIKPDYTRALLELGNVYIAMEEFQLAIDSYRELLKYYPKYTKAWFNLGLALSKLNLDDQAREAYEKLLELKPDHIAGRINLAIAYARSNEVDLAISTLEEAVNIDIDNPDIRYNLALQYEKKDLMSKAVYQFLRVIELDPLRRIAYEQLLDIHDKNGEAGSYETVLFRMNKAFNADLDYYETGKKLRDLEEYSSAIEAYKYALERGNNNRWTIYWIGKSYMDIGELERGIHYFQQVLDIDSEHKFSWYRMGQSYDMLGKKSEAEKFYNELKELDPDFKIVRKSPSDLI